MGDMEKVRRGLALLIGGVVAYLVGGLVETHATVDLSYITLVLMLGGIIAALVGLVWLLVGLWRGDRTKIKA